MINTFENIKKLCLKRMFASLIWAILMIILFVLCPFISVLHPKTTNDIYTVQRSDKYVKVKVDKLYYSGYSLTKTGGSTYGYYYSLKNGESIFVIIPITGTPKTQLIDYEFTGKVIGSNRSYRTMLNSFVKDLNWNNNSMAQVNRNFVISNADYHPTFFVILLWIIVVIFLISLKKIISSIIEFVNPYMYPVCSFLGKDEQKLLIDNANAEISIENFIQINDMYITENYFIDLGKKKISIVPLKEIIWCYRIGEFYFNLKDTAPTFSICFMLLNGVMISVKHKTSDEALELINAIRATGYEIIIGHSEGKRKEAKRIVHEEKLYQKEINKKK